MPERFSDFSQLDLADVEERVYTKYDVSRSDARLAVEYLRCFFNAKRQRPRQLIILPQIADWAWHELILDTERYRSVCSRALGTFLHHLATTVNPAELLNDPDIDTRDRAELEPAGALGRPELDGSGLRQCFVESMAMMRDIYGLGVGSNPGEWADAGWDTPAYRLRSAIRIPYHLDENASTGADRGQSNRTPFLSWLPSRIVRRFGIPLDAAKHGVQEYSNFFLSLRSPDVKRGYGKCSILCSIAWEEHILWTQRYAEDCSRFLGYFLDHVPRMVFFQTCDAFEAA